MVDLGTLGGGLSFATAVNARGQVVGFGGDRAFSWTKRSGMVGLGTLGSVAYAVSDAGQVVGVGFTAGREHAFSWTRQGGIVDLGTLGGSFSVAEAVNAAGQVVGLSFTTGDAEGHATLWQTHGAGAPG
jgi:probable HAF family extracellular repeat protein